MDAGSPKPGTSFVVGTATDDQGPPDSSAVAVPTKQQASWEPQLDVSAVRDTTNLQAAGFVLPPFPPRLLASGPRSAGGGVVWVPGLHSL